MKYKDVFFYVLIAISIFFSGCTGPISPFGGLEVWSGDGQTFLFNTVEMSSKNFSFYPKRQVLHKASDFKIEFNLEDQLDKQKNINPKIKVTYNNKDVTNTFLKSAYLHKEPEQQIRYVFNRLKLKPDRRHQIDVYWSPNDDNNYSRLTYLPPVCSISIARSLASLAPFRPKNQFIETIKKTAMLMQLNPSLLAGLIAQESGFNPTQISHAKAVGLTQITQIAGEEIKKFRPEWTIDPRIDKLSLVEIQNMISRQEISRHHDWRLDPDLAIEGGALYLNYLLNYWNQNENKLLLSKNPKTEITEVILASYNSGPTRVKSKIKIDGENWLDDDELREAFKYVNSVVSYCYHFSEEK